MPLEPAELPMLHAIFGMGLLTLLMGGWMFVARDIATRRGGVKLQEAAHTRELAARLPPWSRRVSDNYNHLFEAPTIFYAIALAIIVGGLADSLYAAHSVVYGLSWIPLAVMIVCPLLGVSWGRP